MIAYSIFILVCFFSTFLIPLHLVISSNPQILTHEEKENINRITKAIGESSFMKR